MRLISPARFRSESRLGLEESRAVGKWASQRQWQLYRAFQRQDENKAQAGFGTWGFGRTTRSSGGPNRRNWLGRRRSALGLLQHARQEWAECYGCPPGRGSVPRQTDGSWGARPEAFLWMAKMRPMPTDWWSTTPPNRTAIPTHPSPADASALQPPRPSKPAPVPRRRRRRRTKPIGAIDKAVLTFPEPRRIRDREHVRFVAKQPCLICGRRPSDAHHLRFAQSRALGRKVSDEFTVPLCRGHHREVHRCGDEAQWWRKAAVDPTAAARSLWLEAYPLPVLENHGACQINGVIK